VRSPALAIAWEFRQGHRFALIALAGYALVLGLIKLLIPGPWAPIELDTPNETAAVLIGPFSMTFLYFLAVFSFGLAGDLAARQSMFPARMFTLPMTTRALVGWPMLYGTAAMASLWLAAVLFVLLPFGVDLPLIWPGLLAMVFLAWTQVLVWMPYGLPGLRVIVAVLWLVSLDAVVLLSLPVLLLRGLAAATYPIGGDSSPGPGGSPISCRAGESIFLRPPAPRRGSSGGDRAGSYRQGWASCCRSSWPFFSSPATTGRSSSSTRFSACCSLRPSWPLLPPRLPGA
jgi:hypothetical protein